jgi:DNA-binding IclR family transcriptional regulator
VLARPLHRRTPSTIVAPGLLREQVANAASAGYAMEREETTIGYCSVAVPLTGVTGLLLGALSITAPTYRAKTSGYVTALSAVSHKLSVTNQIN